MSEKTSVLTNEVDMIVFLHLTYAPELASNSPPRVTQFPQKRAFNKSFTKYRPRLPSCLFEAKVPLG